MFTTDFVTGYLGLMLATKRSPSASLVPRAAPVNDNSEDKRGKRYFALPPMLAPRGLNREASAAYIGVSSTKFDDLVSDKRMPPPKQVDGRRIWDRLALDTAFAALPDGRPAGASKPWDVIS